MNYEEALAYIASLEPRGWRLGLDRMEEFVRRAGLQDVIGGAKGPQFIHVGGTNGKGSVTGYLQSMLVESGYRTGAFFSPYVVDPRERVQYGRELIQPEELAAVTTVLQPPAESLSETPFGGVTEFEFKTAVGFLYYKLKKCQWVALEVGLGGRLDATNVVAPRASVIVSIGLDHMSILGDTHAKIAAEKAGIIKTGVPVIVGQMPEEASQVIEAVAHHRSAPVWKFGRDIQFRPDGTPGEVIIETPKAEHAGLRVGIPGAMQGHNLALAVAAMDAAGATRTLKGMVNGSAKARIPGRFQQTCYRGRTVILDGAHNADAAHVLRESLQLFFFWNQERQELKHRPRIILVTNMLSGHSTTSFYEVIADLVERAFVVPIEFHRARPVSESATELRKVIPDIEECAGLLEGIESACGLAAEDDVVLITGSFYLVGEAIRALGV